MKPRSTTPEHEEAVALARVLLRRSTRPAVFEMHKIAAALVAVSESTESYPGIAHDLERMRTALITIRDESFSGYAYDLAVAALNDTPLPWATNAAPQANKGSNTGSPVPCPAGAAPSGSPSAAASVTREVVEGEFLKGCTERQHVYCTHGFEGKQRKFDRCRECVIDEAVNQIHALQHDIARALSNHNLDLGSRSATASPYGECQGCGQALVPVCMRCIRGAGSGVG